MNLSPMKDIIARLRDHSGAMNVTEHEADGMGEPPRDPLHGSDEAKLRALAADLVRRRGGEVASNLGDVFVAAIQEERRK